jgi:oxaloacetate decarboxylase beta subunit
MFDLFFQFLTNTGYYLADYRHYIMIVVGSTFLYLGTAKKYEPLLLVPIGFGILVGNIPFFKGFGIGIYEANSVLHYLYFGVTTGVYPSIVFLGQPRWEYILPCWGPCFSGLLPGKPLRLPLSAGPTGRHPYF